MSRDHQSFSEFYTNCTLPTVFYVKKPKRDLLGSVKQRMSFRPYQLLWFHSRILMILTRRRQFGWFRTDLIMLHWWEHNKDRNRSAFYQFSLDTTLIGTSLLYGIYFVLVHTALLCGNTVRNLMKFNKFFLSNDRISSVVKRTTIDLVLPLPVHVRSV